MASLTRANINDNKPEKRRASSTFDSTGLGINRITNEPLFYVYEGGIILVATQTNCSVFSCPKTILHLEAEE